MRRLIDADALRYAIEKRIGNITDEDFAEGMAEAITEIDLQPTIDAVPVKRGEWVEYPYCLCYEGALTEDDIACSSCGAVFNVIDNCTETFKYCPHCGARMDVND